jgi:hypothetical protein
MITVISALGVCALASTPSIPTERHPAASMSASLPMSLVLIMIAIHSNRWRFYTSRSKFPLSDLGLAGRHRDVWVEVIEMLGIRDVADQPPFWAGERPFRSGLRCLAARTTGWFALLGSRASRAATSGALASLSLTSGEVLPTSSVTLSAAA